MNAAPRDGASKASPLGRVAIGMLANRAAASGGLASGRRVTASPDDRGMVSRRGEHSRARRAICLYSDT